MKSLPEYSHSFRAKVWKYAGHAGWHFITVPKGVSQKIEAEYGPKRRGWGSIPVTVRVGTSTWMTSIFPDSKTGTFIMGVKAEVRKREGIVEGKTVYFDLNVRGAPFAG